MTATTGDPQVTMSFELASEVYSTKPIDWLCAIFDFRIRLLREYSSVFDSQVVRYENALADQENSLEFASCSLGKKFINIQKVLKRKLFYENLRSSPGELLRLPH